MRRGPSRGEHESGWLVTAALISVLFPPFLLPGVHERYFFAADVLSVVYAFYYPKQWYVPLLVQFASGFSYFPFLFQREPVAPWVLTIVMAAAIEAVALRALFARGRGRRSIEEPARDAGSTPAAGGTCPVADNRWSATDSQTP